MRAVLAALCLFPAGFQAPAVQADAQATITVPAFSSGETVAAWLMAFSGPRYWTQVGWAHWGSQTRIFAEQGQQEGDRFTWGPVVSAGDTIQVRLTRTGDVWSDWINGRLMATTTIAGPYSWAWQVETKSRSHDFGTVCFFALSAGTKSFPGFCYP